MAQQGRKAVGVFTNAKAAKRSSKAIPFSPTTFHLAKKRKKNTHAPMANSAHTSLWNGVVSMVGICGDSTKEY